MEPRTAYLLRVCGFILLVEVLERQAYYGLSADLQIYLTDVLGLTTSEATSNVSARRDGKPGACAWQLLQSGGTVSGVA